MSRVQSVLDGLLVDRPRRQHSPPAAMTVAAMQLVIKPGGIIQCIYGEEIDLAALGKPAISAPAMSSLTSRGGGWRIYHPVNGPLLGPFHSRSEALVAEQAWLETNWLGRVGGR